MILTFFCEWGLQTYTLCCISVFGFSRLNNLHAYTYVCRYMSIHSLLKNIDIVKMREETGNKYIFIFEFWIDWILLPGWKMKR